MKLLTVTIALLLVSLSAANYCLFQEYGEYSGMRYSYYDYCDSGCYDGGYSEYHYDDYGGSYYEWVEARGCDCDSLYANQSETIDVAYCDDCYYDYCNDHDGSGADSLKTVLSVVVPAAYFIGSLA